MSNDYARKVSEALIDQLQRGVAPWQKPWVAGQRSLPFNPTTSKDYNGINSIWLACQGYDDARWLTYKQATALGAQVRKGEKGTVVEYWKFQGQEPVRDKDGNPVIVDGKAKTELVQYSRPRVFHAVVFNAQQIDNMPQQEVRELGPEPERHALAEQIIANSGAKIRHVDGNRAYYRPSTDEVTMPMREQFPEASGYYATMLHELGHWTGHSTRLDRDLSHPFGSEGYAKEELRAEIASLMMGDRLGIGHDPDRHAAYVGSWIKALQEDPREIFRAAADAEKISKYVIGLHQERVQYLDQEQATIDLQYLVNLRVDVQQTSREAIEGTAAARFESDNEQLSQAASLATTARDETRALLQKAVADASPEVRAQWEQLETLESEVREANSWHANAALYLEMARWTPEQQQEYGASFTGTEAEALDEARAVLNDYTTRAATHDRFVQEHGLVLPEGYTSAQLWQKSDSARIALQAAHEFAVPGYSPLESWNNLQAAATEQGLTAVVRLSVGDAFDPPYEVSYMNEAGEFLPLRTEIHRDGKALTYADGERVPGGLWSEDHESQRADLAAGIVKAQVATSQLAMLKTELSAAQADAPVLIDAPENAMPQRADRVYLAIPYRDKDKAKQAAKDAGFRLEWDKEARSWSAPADADLSGLKKWTAAEAKTVTAPSLTTPEKEFGDALRQAGFQLDGDAIMDGKIHRVAVAGDRGNERSGAYSGFLDGHPAGYHQNHKTGVKENWKSGVPVQGVSAAERAKLNAEAAERRQQQQREAEQKFEHASGLATQLFAAASPATTREEYCQSKGITEPGSLRTVPAEADGVNIVFSNREAKQMREAKPGEAVFVAGDLLVPAHDFDGKLWSVQSISPGFKSFMTGGRKSGLHAMAGTDKPFADTALAKDDSLPLVIAEGYATGDTLSKALGQPVVVAFDAGNLEQVAKQLRERYPTREIVIAGDNDHVNEGKVRPDGTVIKNVGREKAQQAAKVVGGIALIPTFPPGSKGTDWNDLAQGEIGVDGVRLRFNAGLSAARDAKQTQQQKQEQQQKQGRAQDQDDKAQKKTRGVSR